jgi:hypothetical protein
MGQRVKIDSKKILAKKAVWVEDPWLERVLLEDAESLAKERLKAGDMTVVGASAGYASTTNLPGIVCSKKEKMNIESRGCMRELLEGGFDPDSVVDEKYAAYNKALVTSPLYSGSCRIREVKTPETGNPAP